jgi:preprotein translocase subunit YajC
LEESSKEGYGTKSAFVPMLLLLLLMVIMMMMMISKHAITEGNIQDITKIYHSETQNAHT